MTEPQAAADARAKAGAATAHEAAGDSASAPLSGAPGSGGPGVGRPSAPAAVGLSKGAGSGTGSSAGSGSRTHSDGGHVSGRAAVVGRATVPADGGSSPRFTRAPGMPPPPDSLVPPQGAKPNAPVNVGGVSV